MAAITAAMVGELRAKTDAPMMECKKALTEAEGDLARPIRSVDNHWIDQHRVGNVRPEPQKHVQQDGQQQDPELVVDRGVPG